MIGSLDPGWHALVPLRGAPCAAAALLEYPRQDMRTLFAGLEEAFDFFGGVPREHLLDHWPVQSW
jgi:hypothetical protein